MLLLGLNEFKTCFNSYLTFQVHAITKGHGADKKHNKKEMRGLFCTSPSVSIAVLSKAVFIMAMGSGLHCTLLAMSALNTASNVGWHSGEML